MSTRGILLVLLPLAGAACGIDDFETVVEDEATIPGSWMPNQPAMPLDFGGGFDGLDLTTDKTFQDQGVEPGDIDGIFVKSVDVVLVDPAELSLGPVVESIELFVSAPKLEKKRIAHIEMVGASADDLSLTVDDPAFNLKPYATASQMTLGADVKLKQRPLTALKIRTSVTLHIDANIAGI